MPVPGQLLGDRYRLDDRIAGGGMGEVWRATDTVLGRGVAVKTMHAGQSVDPGFQERFRHEARAMALLHHRGVADVYDFGETADGRDAYIVMEHVQGQPLNALLAEQGRLTPAVTMSIVAQAARALEAAHQAGIVHRDVKPGNLIIKPDGAVVLVDFGVARSAESAALTGVAEVIGTALYIAPEQVSKADIGPPTDVYALGVVAYHCLAGQPPFTGDNPLGIAMQHLQDQPPPLPPDVPAAVRALVTRAMAKDPAGRFPSAEAMAQAAERAVPAVSHDATTALVAVTRSFPAGVASVGRAAAPMSRTSTFPAAVTPDDYPPAPAPRRRTGLIAAAAAVIVLGLGAIGVALANPGLFSGGGPETGVSTTPARTTPPGRQAGGDGATQGNTPKKTTPARDDDEDGTATQPPDDETTQPSAEPTATTSPPASAPASADETDPPADDAGDTGGGGDGGEGADQGGGDGGDNTGTGGN